MTTLQLGRYVDITHKTTLYASMLLIQRFHWLLPVSQIETSLTWPGGDEVEQATGREFVETQSFCLT